MVDCGESVQGCVLLVCASTGVARLDLLHQYCLWEGKGLSAALTFSLSLSLSPLLWQEVLMKQIHKVRGAGSHLCLPPRTP